MTDRAKPRAIAVNAAGQCFINEALSYRSFVRAMLSDGNGAPGRPFHLICDRHFLWRYGLGPIQPFSGNIIGYVDGGELKQAPTIARLAAAIGVDASTLTATVDTFNVDARDGRDPEFGRGAERGFGFPCESNLIEAREGPTRDAPLDLLPVLHGGLSRGGTMMQRGTYPGIRIRVACLRWRGLQLTGKEP